MAYPCIVTTVFPIPRRKSLAFWCREEARAPTSCNHSHPNNNRIDWNETRPLCKILEIMFRIPLIQWLMWAWKSQLSFPLIALSPVRCWIISLFPEKDNFPHSTSHHSTIFFHFLYYKKWLPELLDLLPMGERRAQKANPKRGEIG